jgi:DNA primase
MVEKKKDNRKFFELRNGMKAIDFRNKDYYDRIDDKEKSLYSPYMIMRYASSVSGDRFYQEHYVEMINECVNKHLFTLSGKHKKLCWMLTSMCGALKQQFHPWVKPMKKVPNKSLQQLQELFPTTKEQDLETLDKIITDKELEELLEAHGKQS